MTNFICKLFRHTMCFFSVCLVLVGCNGKGKDIYQGYVEGEVRYLASPYSGILQNLLVNRGQQVKAEELLFKLDLNPELYHLQIAENVLKEEQNNLKNLMMPKRSPVIQAIKEQIDQIDVELTLAKLRESRFQKLYEKDAASQDNLDEVKAKKERLLNKKEQLMAELKLAQMGERSNVIEAQKQKLEQLRSEVQKNKWIVQKKTVEAPIDGVIQDTFYKEGEFVPAQKPVLSLLSEEDIYIEFFVPVKGVNYLKLNQVINFSVYNDSTNYHAKIIYVSPDAEYMPPLVYSRLNMDKLVYRVKARPEKPKKFTPGQPVTVSVSYDRNHH